MGELHASLEETNSKYMELNKQVEDESLGLQALPKSLVNALRVSEKQAMIAGELYRAQRQTVTREERVYLHAQHEANVAEASVAKFADIVDDLRKVSEMEVVKRTKPVKRNKKNEVVSAKRLENRQRDRIKVSCSFLRTYGNYCVLHESLLTDTLLTPFICHCQIGIQQETPGKKGLCHDTNEDGPCSTQNILPAYYDDEHGHEREQEVYGRGPPR